MIDDTTIEPVLQDAVEFFEGAGEYAAPQLRIRGKTSVFPWGERVAQKDIHTTVRDILSRHEFSDTLSHREESVVRLYLSLSPDWPTLRARGCVSVVCISPEAFAVETLDDRMLFFTVQEKYPVSCDFSS